jgi:hypothetical protein
LNDLPHPGSGHVKQESGLLDPRRRLAPHFS